MLFGNKKMQTRTCPTVNWQRHDSASVDFSCSVNVLEKGLLLRISRVSRYKVHDTLNLVWFRALWLPGLIARMLLLVPVGEEGIDCIEERHASI